MALFPVEKIDISCGGCYCSSWGLTDLYDPCEAKLRGLIDSGEDFETSWCDSKKELISARYSREGNTFTVDVSAWMDDLWDQNDLIYDAVYEAKENAKYRATTQDMEKLQNILDDTSSDADAFIECVRDQAMYTDIDDHATCSEELNSAGLTYEKVMETVEKLEDEAQEVINSFFDRLCWLVMDCVKDLWC